MQTINKIENKIKKGLVSGSYNSDRVYSLIMELQSYGIIGFHSKYLRNILKKSYDDATIRQRIARLLRRFIKIDNNHSYYLDYGYIRP